MAEMVVVVTWMDGKQETYPCYDAKVGEGCLWLSQRMHAGQPTRSIPLANVRIWTREGG